jgi:hypothetical protein
MALKDRRISANSLGEEIHPGIHLRTDSSGMVHLTFTDGEYMVTGVSMVGWHDATQVTLTPNPLPRPANEFTDETPRAVIPQP